MVSNEQRKNPGWLGYTGNEILPSYMGIIISLYKDPGSLLTNRMIPCISSESLHVFPVQRINRRAKAQKSSLCKGNDRKENVKNPPKNQKRETLPCSSGHVRFFRSPFVVSQPKKREKVWKNMIHFSNFKRRRKSWNPTQHGSPHQKQTCRSGRHVKEWWYLDEATRGSCIGSIAGGD